MKTFTHNSLFVSILLSSCNPIFKALKFASLNKSARLILMLTVSLMANFVHANDYALKTYTLKPGEKTWLHGVEKFPKKAITTWAALDGQKSDASAKKHYEMFKGAFPELSTVEQYVKAAYKIKTINQKLYKSLPNRDKVYYHEASNVFVAFNAANRPTTMFRPKEGKKFYDNLIARNSTVKFIGLTEKKGTGRLAQGSSTSSYSSGRSSRPTTSRPTSRSSSPARQQSSSSSHYSEPNLGGSSSGSDAGDGYQEPNLGNNNTGDTHYSNPNDASSSTSSYYVNNSQFQPYVPEDGGYNYTVKPEDFIAPAPKTIKDFTLSSKADNNPANNRSLLSTIKLTQWMPELGQSKSQSSRQALKQFNAYKKTLPEIGNVKEYVAAANALVGNANYTGIKRHVRENGDILVFHKSTGIYAAFNYEGLPYIMLRAENGQQIFNDNLSVYPTQNSYKPDMSAAPKNLKGADLKKTYKTKKIEGHAGEDQGTFAAWKGNKTRYFDEVKRRQYEVFVKGGKLVNYKGEYLNTKGGTNPLKDGTPDAGIFVMDEHGRIYLSKYSILTQFHHSSFLSGGPISSAGEMQITNGVLKKITARSGHYRPDIVLASQILEELKRRGYRTSLKVQKGF